MSKRSLAHAHGFQGKTTPISAFSCKPCVAAQEQCQGHCSSTEHLSDQCLSGIRNVAAKELKQQNAIAQTPAHSHFAVLPTILVPEGQQR